MTELDRSQEAVVEALLRYGTFSVHTRPCRISARLYFAQRK